MFSGVFNPQSSPGIQASINTTDPLGCRDNPCYYGCNQAMMIGNSGTAAANNNPGNLTLGTALDAVYGPSNNNCPGIWIFLPATALAAPNNVAGWYWCVMTSTTVGTAYGISYSPGTTQVQGALALAQAGVLSPAYPPGILLNQAAGGTPFQFVPTVPTTSATNPSLGAGGINSILGPTFPDAPPPSMVVNANIATGAGAYTAPVTENAAVSYPVQGGAVGPAGSMSFEGVASATNSAGAKTVKGKLSATASLVSGSPVTGVTLSITTGVSAIIPRTFVMWDGHQFNTASGTTSSGKFVTAGSVPTFFTLDESGGAAGTTPMFMGVTLQVAVATDWVILQGHYLTANQA